ncbi:hypothetical protein G4B88_028679 [Cannabis sativa]|uniref:RNase H type-1 domain-containing protein n=1 Tax=Cannabis sativa TaxID=3483 RepID=A0A7J6END6_CANSA|nr:hypothetical protein G4B88_028679 [Cannabis sativa]
MGYGKLQKTDISANDSLGQPQLFDVPIAFAKEGDAFYGGSSFNLGSGKHSMSKEHRRKVAVKKDTKNKKSKVGTIPKGKAEALRVSLGYDGCFVVEAHGKNGHDSCLLPQRRYPLDLSCAKAKEVWKLLPYYSRICKYKGGSMFDFLVEIKHHLSIDEFEEQHLTPEGQITRLAGPPEGVYCVYCDAALFPGAVGVGLGFIWTDWKAKIQAAGMCFLPHCSSVTIAEAEAILAALTSCPIDTNNQFEVRTDCKQLVDEFNGGSDSLTMDRSVINKIKRHQRFPRCTKLKFVYRKDNEIAHMLAKRSLEYHLTQSFLISFPEWLAKFCEASLFYSL